MYFTMYNINEVFIKSVYQESMSILCYRYNCKHLKNPSEKLCDKRSEIRTLNQHTLSLAVE
mgnify:CR=1 FL=1